MLRYILFRILQVVPVLLGTTLLIYFMVFSMPGDPIAAMFGDKTPHPSVIAKLRAQYHLDDPFIVQYFIYLKNALTLNFGTSFSGQEVSAILARTIPVTFRLAVIAVVIEFLLALVIGLISGLRKGGVWDNFNLVIGLILMAVPVFVVGFIAQYFLGIHFKIFRTTVSASAPISELILPGLVLGVVGYATSMRLVRSSVIETSGQDFVRAALAKGLTSRRVVRVHILRNSLIPTVTNMAANFGGLLVGATITEGIFNIPGVGNALYQSIIRGETSTVVSFVTIMVFLYLIINLLVDLLYVFLDPRIRYV